MSTALIVLFLALLGYLLMTLFLSLCQDQLVYSPSKKITQDPSILKLPFREVEFETAAKIKLHGWMVGEDYFSKVVVFFHGNGGNISANLKILPIFYRLGLRTFIFDYRGYGRSEGTPSEEGTYWDAETVWRYLTKSEGIAPGRIILYGHSLGGAVAASLASKVKPRALILEASFSSIPELGKSVFPFFPVRMMCKFQYNTRAFLSQISVPVLVIHSPNDKTVPFSHGETLYRAANPPKRFLKIYGTHNEGFINCLELYILGLQSFLSEL
jgi:uncharacterized protein